MNIWMSTCSRFYPFVTISLAVCQALRYRARLAAGLDPDAEDGALAAAAANGATASDAAAAAGDGVPADSVSEPSPRAAEGSEAAQPAAEGGPARGGSAGVRPDGDADAVQWRPPDEDGLTPAAPAQLQAADSTAAAAPAVPTAQQSEDGSRLQHQVAQAAAEQQAAAASGRTPSASAPVDSNECPDLPVGKAELAAAAAAAASNGVTLGELVAHLRREGGRESLLSCSKHVACYGISICKSCVSLSVMCTIILPRSAGSAASLNGLAETTANGAQASNLQSARNSLAKDDDGSRCSSTSALINAPCLPACQPQTGMCSVRMSRSKSCMVSDRHSGFWRRCSP